MATPPSGTPRCRPPDGVVRLELLPGLLLGRDGAEVPCRAIPEGVPTASWRPSATSTRSSQFALDLQQGQHPQDSAPPLVAASLDVISAAYALRRGAAASGWRCRSPVPGTGPRCQFWRR